MAKELFQEGKYQAAEDAFLACARDSTDAQFCSVQFSNAAQCALNLDHAKRACQHARNALLHWSSNPKAHYRLATALSKIQLPETDLEIARQCCDIAMANTCAFALIQGESPPIVGREIVAKHQHPVSRRAAHLLSCIADERPTLVSDEAIGGKGRVIVVNGSATSDFYVRSSSTSHVIGLDKESCLHAFPGAPHTIFVEHTDLSAWRLTIDGSFQARTCVVDSMSLIDCVIRGHHDNAVLVAGANASALIAFSTLTDCRMGIEVREGGSLRAFDTLISKMARQGVSAYGGAREIILERCTIENAGIEGLQCIGPRSPNVVNFSQMTEAMDLLRDNQAPSTARRVAEAASDAARLDENARWLYAELRDCTIRRCGNNAQSKQLEVRSGVTADQGARVVMHGTEISHCGMAAIFIKGGSNVLVRGCRIEFDADGVRVDVNYDGIVEVHDSVMIGKQIRAVPDMQRRISPSARASMRALMGAGSTPVRQSGNRCFSRSRNAPTIEHLRQFHHATIIDTINAVEMDKTRNLSRSRYPGGAGAMYRKLGVQNVSTDYPLGNTFGRNVLNEIDTKNETRVILAACGDIRNVFETLAVTQGSKRIQFVLNDNSTTVLARNIVLLELICRLWPKKGSRKNAESTLLHIWGSIALHKSEQVILGTLLKDLASGKFPSWLGKMSPAVRQEMKNCWSAWASCTRTLSDVRMERDQISSLEGTNEISLMRAVEAAGLPKNKTAPSILRNSELLGGKGDMVNPTLLSSPSLHYNMFESSIFRALDMRDYVQKQAPTASGLNTAACNALKTKAPCVSNALRTGAARIFILPGDMTRILSDEEPADLVDMSNACDYISKPTCLLAAARCVRDNGGVLVLHTMLRIGNDSARVMNVVMRGAKLNPILSVLGFKTRSSHRYDLGSSVPKVGLWVYERGDSFSSSIPCSEREQLLLEACDTWCRGPSSHSRDGQLNIAAWPSAVAALCICSRAFSCNRSEAARKIINITSSGKLFEWELNAHSAVADGLSENVLVVSLAMSTVDGFKLRGYGVHLILCVSSRIGAEDEQRFDVFEWDEARGVCVIILHKKHIDSLLCRSAWLCTVRMKTGQLTIASRGSTCLNNEGVVSTRPLREEEAKDIMAQFG